MIPTPETALGVPIALAFVVPGPPVPWMRAETNGRQRYNPKALRDYKRHVAALAQHARMRCRMMTGSPYPALTSKASRFALDLRIYVTDERKRDSDNILKSIMDSGNRVLWPDDSQVKRHFCDVQIDERNPRVEVSVALLPDAMTAAQRRKVERATSEGAKR